MSKRPIAPTRWDRLRPETEAGVLTDPVGLPRSATREGGRGFTTTEVRWIHRGRVPAAVFEWLGPFDDWIEHREDRYLAAQAVPELGVKVKSGVELDVKAFRGSPGKVRIAGDGRGRLEVWEKWAFPLDAIVLPFGEDASWLAVRKVRRRRSFGRSGGRLVERPVREADLPGCSVEVTEFFVGGQVSWTLGLEANGNDDGGQADLRATMRSLFAAPPPQGLGFELSHSMSYPAWVAARQRSSVRLPLLASAMDDASPPPALRESDERRDAVPQESGPVVTAGGAA